LEVSGKGPVRLRVVQLSATTASMEIGVDYAQAPVPLLNYDADFCDVVQGRPDIVLVFGKLKAGSEELRTKIEITFSNEYFFRQLWRGSRDLQKTIETMAKGESLSPIDSLKDTEKVQCLRANNVFMAVLGGEAVLDFYYISPGDIHYARLKQKKEIALDPVVRVVVSLHLLLEFLNKCKPFGESLKTRFPEE
jgi:hypothetical protein